LNSSAARNALMVMAVIASGAALLWLRDILTPLALALFLMVMIDGLARVLHVRLPGVSRRAATPLSVIFFILVFGVTIAVVAENARVFGQDVEGQKARLDAVIGRIAALGGFHAPRIDEMLQRLNLVQFLGAAARTFQDLAAQLFLVLIYLGFLLVSRVGFKRKAERLFDTEDDMKHATAVFIRIRDGVERYLWIQTVTGLMIAGASWLVMMLIGMESAFFWAFLIFVASYIPIIGGFVGIALPPVFALVQFDEWWRAAVLLVVLQVVQFVVGNVVQPRMQGQSLNLDPVVVLLALALWGALWGVPGMFLSTPLTVVMMIILAQFRSSRWLAILLSGNGRPETLSDGPSDPSRPPSQERPPPEAVRDRS
jgi:AI-2 transport protein TqsA